MVRGFVFFCWFVCGCDATVKPATGGAEPFWLLSVERGRALSTDKSTGKHQMWGSNYKHLSAGHRCGFFIPAERTQSQSLQLANNTSLTLPLRQRKWTDILTLPGPFIRPHVNCNRPAVECILGVQLNPCVLNSECPSSVHTLWPSQRTAAFNTGPVFKRTSSWVWQTGETSPETDRCW